ncbi:MAG TPA: phosphoribosylanthranilate isomerase [Bacillales bacterium]|nr:phosphoribosylanthranilate isomerase [Bacillales bacterium]
MARLQVKYCGSHSLEDLLCTTNSRADYIGIVFAKESRRRVNPDKAEGWLEKTRLKYGQKLVGLFVNAPARDIQRIVEKLPLDVIQCHGSESVEDVREIRDLTGLPVWKALHHDEQTLEAMRSYEGTAGGYIIDCKVKGQWGGTGQSFDWSSVPGYMKEARRQGVACFIAGGIDAGNVGELLRYHPDGIDVSSGIEKNGQKSRETIRRLEERIGHYEANLS